MKTVLVTGGTGGIGRYLIPALKKHVRVLLVSRRNKDDPYIFPCDLTTQEPKLRTACKIDWIIHLATSYNQETDERMLRNLLRFAKKNKIQHFLYSSSWVVHFPTRKFNGEYIRMKKRCEELLHKLGKGMDIRIIRPSVVLGEGLLWHKTLQKISWFYPLLPHYITRCFVSVEDICKTIVDIVTHKKNTKTVTCLGRRKTLRSVAAAHGPYMLIRKIWLLGAIGAIALGILLFQSITEPWLRALGLALLGVVFALPSIALYILPKLHSYFAGYMEHRFYPTTEDDIIGLCCSVNDNTLLRGYDNAHLWFRDKSNKEHTHVLLREFNKVEWLDAKKKIVRVQAGIHFDDLLRYLSTKGLWLENYPNYHFITVGACIATSVHGSSLENPFLADLVHCMRIYDKDKDEILTISQDDRIFKDILFQQRLPEHYIILTADLKVCEDLCYKLTSVPVAASELDFSNKKQFGDGEHFEIRINRLDGKKAYIQQYESFPAKKTSQHNNMLSIKADNIGNKWNMLEKYAAARMAGRVVSHFFVNFEWFFTPKDFELFWQELQRRKCELPLYKLLIRLNCNKRNSSYYNTISIDVSARSDSRTMLACQDLFERYQPLEHQGKYCIGR